MLKTNQSISPGRQITIFQVMLTLSILACLVWATPSAAQENCANVLTEVQSLYEAGRTADMIVQLTRCLPDGIPDVVERVQAYKLLALAYIAEDYLKGAEDAVEKLLDLNEKFEPDRATDPSKFIDMVEESKKVRAQKKGRKKKLYYIGGGAVLAGVVTAAIVIATGGDSPAVRLPDPPVFPDNQ